MEELQKRKLQDIADDEEESSMSWLHRKDKNLPNLGRKLFEDESSTFEDNFFSREGSSLTTDFQTETNPSSIVNVEEGSENSRSGKSSETESIRISELDEMDINRGDIKPLPNSLEEIYTLAQEVKKKVDKKTSKKKDKKAGKESMKDV